MSAAHYQVHEDSFGVEQIFLSDDRDISYNISCETSTLQRHPLRQAWEVFGKAASKG